MRERCNNHNFVHFDSYGGRGIRVCPEWNTSYPAFKEWAINNGYKENLTLDRINNEGDYCPENCRWATSKEQANNRRSNRILEIDGEKHNIQGWCEITGLPRRVVDGRLRLGWSAKKAITTPYIPRGV